MKVTKIKLSEILKDPNLNLSPKYWFSVKKKEEDKKKKKSFGKLNEHK